MVRPTRFEITRRTDGAAVALSVAGELDMSTVPSLAEQVRQQLDGGAVDLTLDLRELTFMDSSGLRLLIELNDQARQEGFKLRLFAPQEAAAALVLRVTGADTALPFDDLAL